MPSLPSLRSVAIANPCQEPWQEMTPSERGRYCSSCEKTVLDFAAMTPAQIVAAVEDADGHLCARVSRDAEGRLVTLPEPSSRPRFATAAGFVLASALAGSAAAQAPAMVSGRAIVAKPINADQPPAGNAEVLFVHGGQVLAQTKTDDGGRWQASLAPGQYDVLVRTGPMVGERINDVNLHSGSQSFGDVALRWNMGHLGIDREPMQTSFIGEVAMTYRYPLSYLFKHPLRYIRHLPHNFG